MLPSVAFFIVIPNAELPSVIVMTVAARNKLPRIMLAHKFDGYFRYHIYGADKW